MSKIGKGTEDTGLMANRHMSASTLPFLLLTTHFLGLVSPNYHL